MGPVQPEVPLCGVHSETWKRESPVYGSGMETREVLVILPMPPQTLISSSENAPG